MLKVRAWARALSRGIVKRGQRRALEIPIERAGVAVADHVERTSDRKGGDRQPRGEGLEQDEAERVRKAGKDEGVGAGVDVNERLPVQFAEEIGVGKARLQPGAIRSVADDDLRARQIEREKRLEVLFDRQAPAG